MNRIKFEAKILDLYSVDYDYLQDSIEDEVSRLVRQSIANPGESGVIKGFKLQVSPSDNTKVMIYSDGTWNSAISKAGIIVEIEDNIDLIGPSTASTTGAANYIYIRSYTTDGTYNKNAGVIEENVQKAIDYYDYARVYDRQLDSWEVVVYTTAEYLNLTQEEQDELIYIGYFIDTNPIITVTTAGRYNATTFIADGSVTTSSINTGDMLLLQTNVDNSVTIDDRYTGTPEDLEDDLNKIRSYIRHIRGTTTWDEDDPNNLRVFDASINALHSDGVIENAWDDYNVIPAGGMFVTVQTGKALIDGVMQVLSSGNEETFEITEQEAYHTAGEGPHVAAPVGNFFELNHSFVTNLVLTPTQPSYYYHLDSSTGRVYTLDANFVGDTVYCEYDYGYQRFDVIEIGPNLDIAVVQGESGTSTGLVPEYPRPPAVPVVDEGYQPLAIIKVTPNMGTIESYDIEISKRYTPMLRDLKFIACTDTSTVQNTVNKVTYHSSNYLVDTDVAYWTADTYDDIDFYKSDTLNTFVTAGVLATDDDELWIVVDKNIWSATIKVEWNSTPDADYDEELDIDLQWRYTFHYQPILITKGLSAGIHKIKIKVTTAAQVNFYGIFTGKASYYYKQYAQNELETYFNNILVENSSPYNIAIGVDNLASGISGSGNIAIGYQALKSNTTSNNIAIGYNALDANTVGQQNVAIGTDSLGTNITGRSNTAIGYKALSLNTTNYNTAVGYQALVNNTGINNTVLGANAFQYNTGSNNIAIGYAVGNSVLTASGTIVIGTSLTGSNTSNSIFIGSNLTDGNTLVGNIYNDTNTTAAANVVIGTDGRLQRSTVADDRGVPVGTVVAWIPGYFNSTYTTYTNMIIDGSLPTSWRICNGTACNVTGSPIFGGSGRYLPNLDDNRFLMGVSSIPTSTPAAGSNYLPGHYHHNEHNHKMGRIYSPSGTDYFQLYNSAGSLVTIVNYTGNDTKNDSHNQSTVNWGGAATQDLYTLDYTGDTQSITSAAVSNVPQYLSCRYIMRVI